MTTFRPGDYARRKVFDPNPKQWSEVEVIAVLTLHIPMTVSGTVIVLSDNTWSYDYELILTERDGMRMAE